MAVRRIVFEGTEQSLLVVCGVMDADGQHKRKLARAPPPSPPAAACSRDSSTRRQAHRLIITTLAGKQVRTFTFAPTRSQADSTWHATTRPWSFEGYPTESTVAERRKGVRAIARGPFLYYPAWSPHGRLLAFRRCRDELRSCDLMVTRRDGSQHALVARNLDTDDFSVDATLRDPWSPNGRWLVFARSLRIYVIHRMGQGYGG
jgi:hypothetical protein